LNKNILLLWQGQIVSQFGTQAYTIVMMFWLMQTTGSSGLMSVIMALSVLPSVLLGPLSGVIIDRYSRKKIIIVTDVVRGLAVLVLAGVMYFKADEHALIISCFVVVALVNGLAKTFFQPAIESAIPDLVSKEKLMKVNAMFNSSNQSAILLGQAAGGVLFRILGAPLLLLLDAISYLLSAFNESFIKMESKPARKTTSWRGRMSSYRADLVAGISYVRNTKGMLQTMLFATSLNFLISPVLLLMPFYVTEQLGEGVQWYGFLLAAMGLGTLLGYFFGAMFKVGENHRATVMFMSVFTVASSLMLLAMSETPLLSMASQVITGIGLGVFNLHALTLLQTTPPEHIRGRVMSFSMSVTSIAIPLGLLFSGMIGEATNNDTQVIYGLCGLLITLVTLCVSFNQNIKDFLLGNAVDTCEATR
jgi:MFS family permease